MLIKRRGTKMFSDHTVGGRLPPRRRHISNVSTAVCTPCHADALSPAGSTMFVGSVLSPSKDKLHSTVAKSCERSTTAGDDFKTSLNKKSSMWMQAAARHKHDSDVDEEKEEMKASVSSIDDSDFEQTFEVP